MNASTTNVTTDTATEQRPLPIPIRVEGAPACQVTSSGSVQIALPGGRQLTLTFPDDLGFEAHAALVDGVPAVYQGVMVQLGGAR